MSDQLADGHRVRVLTLVDNFSRESLAQLYPSQLGKATESANSRQSFGPSVSCRTI